MKLHYDAETDSLYIDLSNRAGSDAREVAPGVVLDFDESGSVVGIDIQHASKVVDINRLDVEAFPLFSKDEAEDRIDTGSE